MGLEVIGSQPEDPTSSTLASTEHSETKDSITNWDLCVNAIARFLQPLLTRESTPPSSSKHTFSERLVHNVLQTESDQNKNASDSYRVIQYALDLLHNVLALLSTSFKSDHGYAPKDLKLIFALLDLISIEGVYQNVSPGLGIPLDRRAKLQISSLLKNKKHDTLDTNDRSILTNVCACLKSIHELDLANDVLRQIQDRTLSDLLTTLAELALDPDFKHDDYREQFYDTLDRIPTLVLLPILTLTLHTSSPEWYRQPVTQYLSLIPYSRSHGVKDVITFLVNIGPGNQMKLEDLEQTSKLIGSLPSTVSSYEEYFPKIAEQLVPLLDIPSKDSSIGQAAAFIIGNIVTRRKSAVVTRIFFSPIVDQIRPPINKRVLPTTKDFIDEVNLESALKRVALLVSYPNPALTKWLFKPIYVSLWAIFVFAKVNHKLRWQEMLFGVLRSYMKVSGELSDLVLLAQYLLYDGSAEWMYSNGSLGGIEVRRRETSDRHEISPQEVDKRVEAFMGLLANVDQGGITTFFLTLLKNWLQSSKNKSQKDEDDPLRTYADLKLLASMMDKYSENVAQEPKETLELVYQILDDHVTSSKARDLKKQTLSQPSFYTLNHIVGEENDANDMEDDTDVLSLALNLLTLIVTSEDEDKSKNKRKISFKHFVKPLQYVAYSAQASSNVSGMAMNILTLLNFHNNIPEKNALPDTSINQSQTGDHERCARVLEYVQDPLIPIRAQGLHILQGLIESRSPVLDIPQTIELLISMLQDQESFVYLNVIKCLTAITNRHYHTVINVLLLSYVDKQQVVGIDARLRIGEALLRTVERLGQATTAEDAERIGTTMIGLGGRRNKRSREKLDIQKRRQALEAQKPSAEDRKDYAEIMKQVETELGLVDVVENGQDNDVFVEEEKWVSNNGEEDIRIRTSALSILGALLETNIHAVSGRILAQSLDSALYILSIEQEETKTTLRRAALILILSAFRSVEKNPGLECTVLTQEVQKMRRVVSYVQFTDKDGLVREHAGAVLDGLEALTGISS